MRERLLTFLLFGLCVAGSVAGALTYMQKDRTAPVITFRESEISYNDTENEKALLEGAAAMDDRDGDVTGSLIIEGVYFDATGDQCIVIYAAEDSSHNVAKVERRITKTAGAR